MIIAVKRDPHSKASTLMCQENEAYCWMQACMPFPEGGCSNNEVLSCYSVEKNLTCCSDPNVKCDVMDNTCNWECLKAEPNDTNKNEFCFGGMDMLMTGFETTDNYNPCIILFFNAWTLDTRVKFAFGCIGVAFLGFGIEALIALRRRISG